MNIEVKVDEVTLATVLHEYDGEQTTVGDRVVYAITERLAADRDIYPELRTRAAQIRDEEIREAIAPLVAEAMTSPVQPTNEWGETLPGAKATTLRDVIVAEARKQFTHKADNYSRGGQTVLQKLVADEVTSAFKSVIADEVKAARAEVATQIGAMVADAVAAGMRK